MRCAVFVLLLLVAVAGSPQAEPSHRPKRGPTTQPTPSQTGAKRQFEEDQKAIGELQQREITAVMAIDINELLSTWADDGVLLPPNHAPVVGRDSLQRFFEQYKKELGNNDLLGYDENWEEVQVVGNWAYQWGTVNARIRPPAGEGETAIALHAIRVLKRQPEGSWVIARAIYNRAPAPQSRKPVTPQPKPPSETKPPQ